MMVTSILILMTYHLKLSSWPIRWMVIIKKIADMYQFEKDFAKNDPIPIRCKNKLLLISLQELIFKLSYMSLVLLYRSIVIYIFILNNSNATVGIIVI